MKAIYSNVKTASSANRTSKKRADVFVYYSFFQRSPAKKNHVLNYKSKYKYYISVEQFFSIFIFYEKSKELPKSSLHSSTKVVWQCTKRPICESEKRSILIGVSFLDEKDNCFHFKLSWIVLSPILLATFIINSLSSISFSCCKSV